MLPVKVYPYEHELLSSWLLRVSFLNGTDIRGLSNKLFDNAILLIKDIDKFLSYDKIEAISSLTEIHSDKIYKLTLHSYLSNLSQKELKIKSKWKWVIPSGARYTLKTNGLQYCSECLKENKIYFSIFSRLSWNISCKKHKILLNRKCPRCNNQYNYHLKKFSQKLKLCTYCNFDLSFSESEILLEEAVELELFLNKCILTNQINPSFYKFLDTTLFELFYTIRILFKFLITMRKNKKIIDDFSNYSNFIKNYWLSDFYSSLSIDLLPINQRMYILHNLSIILKMDTLILKSILIKNNITYKQFLGSNNNIPHSKTIKYLSEELKIRTSSCSHNTQNKKIKPNSKETVDILMYEIENFL